MREGPARRLTANAVRTTSKERKCFKTIFLGKILYSQTCEQRPPMGSQDFGCC